MELTPIQSLPAMEPMQPMVPMDRKLVAIDTGSASFIDIFRGMVDNVIETNEQVDRDMIDLMLGNIDDLATVKNNIVKANTAVDLLVTVKNEVISAYNSIINMQI